jgi:hypothetical protein
MVVKHARYYWLLPAESHLKRRLFGAMVRRIDALPAPAGQAERVGAIKPDRRAGMGSERCS